jgi:hypothetical protein
MLAVSPLHLRDEGAFVFFQKKKENVLLQRILSVEDWGEKDATASDF